MKKLLIPLLALSLNLNAECYDDCYSRTLTDFYIGVSAGVVVPMKNSTIKGASSSVLYRPTIPGTSLFDLPLVEWKNHYQTGYEASMVFGFTYEGNWRMESEFLYQNFNRKITGHYTWREIDAINKTPFARNSGNPVHDASARTNLYCLMSNTYYDFKNCSKWTPSLGAGVGVAWVQSSSTSRKNTLVIEQYQPPLDLTAKTIEKSPSLYSVVFAWQAKAGLTYQLCNQISLALNYRLLGTSRLKSSSSKIITNPKTTSKAIFKIPQHNVKGLLNNSLALTFNLQF